MPCGPTAVHKQPRRPEGISFTNPESPRRTKLGNESGIIPRLCPKVGNESGIIPRLCPKVGNESDIIPQLCPKVGNDIPFITHFTKDNHAKTMNDVPPETYKTLYNKKTAQNKGQSKNSSIIYLVVSSVQVIPNAPSPKCVPITAPK